MRRNTLRFRLTAWYSLLLVSTFTLLGISVWLAVHQLVFDSVDRDLRGRLALMRDYLNNLQGGSPALQEELAEQSAFAPAGTQYQLRSSAGAWLYRSPAAQQWTFAVPGAAELPPRGRVETVEVRNKHLRVISAAVRAGVLQVAIPIDGFEDLLSTLAWTLLIAAPLLLSIATWAGYWISGRALRPVAHIDALAREISAHRLSERIPLSGAGDELDGLKATLNAMFARLEAAFQRVTQFSADASHELRTPVTIMRTTAELALARPRTIEEHCRSWALVLTESERTSHLLDDLMLLVRADSASDGLAMGPIDLADTVREACEEASVLARSAGLQFETRLLPACPFFGDADALRRLVLVLLDNAVKYTPQGAVHVTMSEEAGGVVIEVRDSGIGIARDDQPHIFERFYRASKDRSRGAQRIGGAGLGLSIARWLAERHGGQIELETDLGVGSTFRIHFPNRAGFPVSPTSDTDPAITETRSPA